MNDDAFKLAAIAALLSLAQTVYESQARNSDEMIPPSPAEFLGLATTLVKAANERLL